MYIQYGYTNTYVILYEIGRPNTFSSINSFISSPSNWPWKLC